MNIPTTIRLNGQTFTRQSVAVRVNGVFRVVGVDNCKWDDEVPTELVSGMNDLGLPVGKAQGNYTCSASIAVYADEAPIFEGAIIAGDPLSLGSLAKATFQLLVTAREAANTMVVAMINCNVKKVSDSVGSGGEALVREYELQPTAITRNGLSLVSLLPAL